MSRTQPRAPGVAAVLAVVLAAPPAGFGWSSVATAPPRPRAPYAVGSGAGPATVLAAMTEAQRVGQLFMVGGAATGVSAATVSAVQAYHVGSVILTGRSSAGTAAVRTVTDGLQSLATPAATGGVPLLISADQEGGYVQTLSGPGFSTMPTALAQGSWPATQLTAATRAWGAQLAGAGVNLDLAPVMDTVPPNMVATNQPIGRYQREYGNDPGTVATKGTAVLRGLHAGGVASAVKHFPGLGRVVGNTDTTAGVVDSVTTRGDPYLAPFAAGISAGASFVTVSLATYSRIDPARLAVFSPTVIQTMLRGDLRFPGVVISDDLGDAAAVQSVAPGDRAVGVLAAGGDLVLTVDPTLIPTMVDAVLARAQTDPAFAAAVNASTLRVLIAKQQAGLLGGDLAAGSTSGQVSVVQRADDDSVLARDATGSGWSTPTPLGGRARYGPAAASVGGGPIPIAVTGSNGAVYRTAYSGGASAASWQLLGGLATSTPAIASGPGSTDVAVRGTDGALWVRSATTAGRWGTWDRIGGGLADAPAMTYGPDGTLVVVVTGTDQQVWQVVRRSGVWSGWVPLGGAAVGAPGLAVNRAPGGSRCSSGARTRRCGISPAPPAGGRAGSASAAFWSAPRPPQAPGRVGSRSSARARPDGSMSGSAPTGSSARGPGCRSDTDGGSRRTTDQSWSRRASPGILTRDWFHNGCELSGSPARARPRRTSSRNSRRPSRDSTAANGSSMSTAAAMLCATSTRPAAVVTSNQASHTSRVAVTVAARTNSWVRRQAVHAVSARKSARAASKPTQVSVQWCVV